MIASNYEYIEDGQKLYTLSEAKRELTRRTKAKRKSKAYKQRLLKQRVIGFTLLCAVLMFGVVGWYAITYMAKEAKFGVIEEYESLDWLIDDMIEALPQKDKIEIVKYIVDVKLDEKKKREDAKKNAEMRQRLLEIKAKRQDAALENMSDEDLDKALAELSE